VIHNYITTLERMIREDTTKETDPTRILIESLREEREFHPMKTRNPTSPADKIVLQGNKVVPYLIEAITNDSFTRSVIYYPSLNMNKSDNYVLRIGDCAKEILVLMTGQSYGDRFIHSRDAKVTPREIQQMYKKWWDSQQK